MNRRKLDPRLCEAISGLYQNAPGRFPVSVRLAPQASGAQLARVAEIVGRAIRAGQPTVVADVTLHDLAQLADHPAVVAVRLSQTLQPVAS